MYMLTWPFSIPILAIIGVLFWLHRRNLRRQRQEDQNDPHRSLDFGLEDKPKPTSNFRKSIFGEKSMNHKQQLSLDMDMSTPYLLPPQLQDSRESLHSLAHSVQNSQDPYRPVEYAASDVGSIREARRGPGGDQASVYTASTRSGVPRGVKSPTGISFPRPPPQAADPFQRRHTPASLRSPISPSGSHPTSPIDPRQDPFLSPSETSPPPQSTPYPQDNAAAPMPPRIEIPKSDMPFTIDVALSPQERTSPASANPPVSMSAKIETAESIDEFPAHAEPQRAQIGDTRNNTSSMDDFTPPAQSPPPFNITAYDPSGQAQAAPGHDSIYSDYNQQDQADHEDDRGRRATRFLDDVHRGSTLLAAPQQDERRLSVGLRPLPPDEVMDTEDPEHRANRIRSFYKEYFEDTQPQPPLPGPIPQDLTQQAPPRQQSLPRQQSQPRQPSQGQDGGYYEDYDGAYLENTYIDPGSKSFVMPYAQPVHRRAMTPPPRGPRMRGPLPPRAMHGSMGGMSVPGGGSPFRPGSATSSRLGPRPDSSASARIGPRGRPRPPMAPPAALTTLPNPAKLGDDTFALMSVNDFAPPDTFKDRTRGRSQSPVPEQRPYHLGVPIASPLASSYDELASIPSP